MQQLQTMQSMKRSQQKLCLFMKLSLKLFQHMNQKSGQQGDLEEGDSSGEEVEGDNIEAEDCEKLCTNGCLYVLGAGIFIYIYLYYSMH